MGQQLHLENQHCTPRYRNSQGGRLWKVLQIFPSCKRSYNVIQSVLGQKTHYIAVQYYAITKSQYIFSTTARAGKISLSYTILWKHGLLMEIKIRLHHLVNLMEVEDSLFTRPVSEEEGSKSCDTEIISDIPRPRNVDVNNSVDRVTMSARGLHGYNLNILAVKSGLLWITYLRKTRIIQA